MVESTFFDRSLASPRVVQYYERKFKSKDWRKALFETKAAGQPCLALSVDARNRPARELYRRLGFESHDRREVFLAVWGPPAG